jgi:hypothetical protein
MKRCRVLVHIADLARVSVVSCTADVRILGTGISTAFHCYYRYAGPIRAGNNNWKWEAGMTSTMRILLIAAAASPLALGAAQAQQAAMTFFVTSAGPGKGADLGGLDGADRHCQNLAQAAGAGGKTWRAYLSTQGAGAVNAKDRIGRGPWQNAKGAVIAKDVADLHGPTNNLTKQTALTEKGELVNGRGDSPNMHDILTGSQPDGTAFTVSDDRTCGNWTKSGQGAAMVGHHDRTGLDDSPPAKSWNSSHPSRGPGGGCAQDDLRSTGGAGLLYCFAVN